MISVVYAVCVIVCDLWILLRIVCCFESLLRTLSCTRFWCFEHGLYTILNFVYSSNLFPFFPFLTLFRRLESQLERIRSITGEALIEQCMESTLDSVESSMQTFCVMVSPEWLKDSRLREKIFLELNEVRVVILLVVACFFLFER